ncbi:hypothetical protein AB4Y32_37005 [Paraburkholderia phymatum]|uniref:Uncharacterized protein n=1 Tax=Paraburkholderia phymatum TaxID=148447 RepID=A0ACC6UC24_9BURK
MLRITQQDRDLARLVTPTLDSGRFAVGKVWPLAWHQLRRTGTVNMQASGLVSDASLQFQLKHVSRAMSLYYGRGYARGDAGHDVKPCPDVLYDRAKVHQIEAGLRMSMPRQLTGRRDRTLAKAASCTAGFGWPARNRIWHRRGYPQAPQAAK